MEHVATRLAVQPVGETAKRLLERVDIPMLRLFEQPLMRTIGVVGHLRLLAFGSIFADTLCWLDPSRTSQFLAAFFAAHVLRRILQGNR